jgi:hypothetical protein
MAFLIAGQVYVAQSLFKSQAYASSNITATGAAEETNLDTTLSFLQTLLEISMLQAV